MKTSRTTYRIAKDRLFVAGIVLLSFLAVVPLLLILFYIIKNGISVINWDFLARLPNPMGEEGGGIVNAIVGTLMLIVIACLFSVPVGITTGIYLNEYRKGAIAEMVRLAVEVIMGIPSIIIGIIAYTWIVIPLGSFSALSGGVALAIMMLPVIIKSTEETLKLIPNTLREASLALGVPYSTTILKVIVPAGMSGIVTGILLGIARVAGETAPLLFTAFGNPFMNYNILKPVNSLPLTIFVYATSPYENWHALAWGASFVLIVFVLLMNFITKLVTRR
jgi:phosphate transport system permease protein